MECKFKPGDKVTTIYDWRPRGNNGEIFPKKGEVYTVRDVVMGHAFICGSIREMPSLLFEEIRNVPQKYILDGWSEIAFAHFAFKKVDPVDQVEKLKDLLKPGAKVTETFDEPKRKTKVKKKEDA